MPVTKFNADAPRITKLTINKNALKNYMARKDFFAHKEQTGDWGPIAKNWLPTSPEDRVFLNPGTPPTEFRFDSIKPTSLFPTNY